MHSPGFRKDKSFKDLVCGIVGIMYNVYGVLLVSCFDLKFINFELKEEGESFIEQAKITLNGFINYVKSKANG
ncbi:MAG: hypothetical protein ACUVT3_02445 [Ignavibacterium sp.]